MSLAFLATAMIIVVVPGPGALLTISTGVSCGVRASMVTAVGCTIGIVPHMVAAITGTAALLRASGTAFETLKLVGVGYLLLMAVLTWRDRRPVVIEASRPHSALRMIASAVLTNLLNPKLTLFFFAFLPQFVPASATDQVPRMLELSAVFMAMTLVVFITYGAFAAAARRHLVERPQLLRRLRQVFAASFASLGLRLATTAR